MGIPIEMPNPLPISSRTFSLLTDQLVTPVGTGGFQQVIQRAAPYWVAEYQSPPLRAERYQAMEAFLDSLEGSMNTFLGWDPRKPRPAAYMHLPAGSEPWGTVTASSANYATSELLLQATSPLKITKGDLIQVTIGNVIRLFRARNSPAENTTVGLTVSPRPPTFTAAAYPVRLTKPGAEMKMIGAPEWNDSVDTLPSVRFKAIQFIDRNT